MGDRKGTLISEYKKYKELLPEEKLMLHDNCFTCKHRNGNECTVLNIKRESISDLDFVCDFHKLRNSGAFRRKRRKIKKEIGW